MTTLITGGASQVGLYIAQLLKDSGRDAVFASRSGKRIPDGFRNVQLDWYDQATFHQPFELGPFEAVYLIGPPETLHPAKTVIPFIDLAVEKGVKRFLYLSASLADEENDEIGLGMIPRYLKEKGLDYVNLRPTWFIDNLLTTYKESIREKAEIGTVIPTGRTPFVAAEDIAKAAFEGIVNDENPVKDFIVIGPELLTYDELASITSEVVGRRITHKAISPEELEQICRAFMADDLAKAYVGSELKVEKGSEEKWLNMSEEDQKKFNVKVIVGKTSVRDWVEGHKDGFN